MIIDGIDVSKCKNFVFNEVNENNNCFNEAESHINCKYNLNCYFKQLQRAKAENDKFKNFVKDLLFDVSCENWLERFIFSFNDWKKEMVSENERLKECLQKINEYLKTLTSIDSDFVNTETYLRIKELCEVENG